MRLDAVGVTARDMKRSVEFYSLLGFEFGAVDLDAAHVEPVRRDGEPRLMIDSFELANDLLGKGPEPSNHSHFAMACAEAAEVDQVTARVRAGGFRVVREPWDAFWGQRYAIVADPDGYQIDLFAELGD